MSSREQWVRLLHIALMSFGSAIGAVLVMPAARFVFKEPLRRRFAHRLHRAS